MDENPETFQHPQSGDAGKSQDYSQQAPGFSGVSQSRAGMDFHHELVIYCFRLTVQDFHHVLVSYCFKLTVRRFTEAGSVLRLLHIVAYVYSVSWLSDFKCLS